MFVSRADHALHVRSFDDPLLRRLRIGVPAVGEGYDTPPLAALGRRGIAENLKLYPVTGLGGTKSMPAQMIDDLVEERIDLGILWGPSAGYFAARSGVAMTMQPTQASDGPAIPLTMAVSIGVRRGNTGLRDLLDAALAERKEQIARVLAAYHVPAIGE
jgi:mxaJ protein